MDSIENQTYLVNIKQEIEVDFHLMNVNSLQMKPTQSIPFTDNIIIKKEYIESDLQLPSDNPSNSKADEITVKNEIETLVIENIQFDANIRHRKSRYGRKPEPEDKFPHKCKHCIRAFARQTDLEDHEERHAGKKPYICNVCLRIFTQKCNLKRHERTHTGEKPYVCNICNRALTSKFHLKIHQRTHTGEKPYACEVCSRSFVDYTRLIVHRRTHTGVKPYACKFCKRAFNTQGDLKMHERIHTGEKPHTCKHCNRSFRKTDTLKNHEITHTKEKRYNCGHCGHRFSLLSYLRKHEKIHSGQIYMCDYCNKIFKWRHNFTTHIKLHQSGPDLIPCQEYSSENVPQL